MKLLILAIIFATPALVFAQGDNRTVESGTTFSYKVKEGKTSYNLNFVVKQWNWDTIQFQWQSFKPKPAKGSITMMFGAIGESKGIKLKPKPGKVVLPADVNSIVLPYDVFDSLFNIQVKALVFIDGRYETLTPGKIQEAYPLNYNKERHKVLYGEGTNDKGNKNKVVLGFIEYMNDIIILANYVNGTFSMQLESISSPNKNQSQD